MTIVRCSRCGKATAAEAALCAHCGLRVQEPKRRDPEVPLTCPACHIAMDLVWLASIHVDVCGVCKGVWFDNGELVDLPKRVTDRELADAAAQMLRCFAKPEESLRRPAYLPCPVCAGHLTRNNFRGVSGILTDHCRHCGTWVDNPSILRILQLFTEHRLPDAEEAAPPREVPLPPRAPVVDREDLLAALRPPLRLRNTGDADGLTAFSVVWILLEILGYFF